MSRIDDLLERSADEVRQAVARMPEREVTTVETRSTRQTYLTVAGAVAAAALVVLAAWAVFAFTGTDDVDPIEPAPTPVDADALPMPLPPGPLPAGSYATDVLGPTFGFVVTGDAVTDGWVLQVAAPGEVAISHPQSTGPGNRDIWFGHPDSLSDPADPFASGWPIDDLDGWLEANAEWVVEGPMDTTVGGRSAVQFTLAGQPRCREPQGPGDVPCPTLVFDDAEMSALFLSDNATFVVWWVEDVEGLPFVIAAGGAQAWPEDFRADVESVVASVAIEPGAPAPDPGPSTIESDADLRWEGTDVNGSVITVAGDLPEGYPARTWLGSELLGTTEVGDDAGLHDWVLDVDPAVPAPVHAVDDIVSGADGPTAEACGGLQAVVVDMDPNGRLTEESFFRAILFSDYAADRAAELGCTVMEGPDSGNPWWEITSPDGPSSAPGPEGDTGLLAEQARAAADEVGDPELEAAIEDAIDSGLLEFSGTPEEAIVNLLGFSWLLDTTNPEPEMLDLFLATDGPARSAWEESDLFGADGLIVVTGEGEYEVEGAEAEAVADYSPSIAATSPEDAVVVEVVVSIPEIEVRGADGSAVRTVPERASQPLAYVLVPGDVGWLLWSELS